jgi:Sigma-70 region 2
MDDHDWLAQRFKEHRTHLRAVAYRMLGSLSEADDALQEVWLHLSRSNTTSGLSLCTKPTSPLLHPSVSPALTTSGKVAGSVPVSQPFRKPSSSSMNAKVGERGRAVARSGGLPSP